MAVSLAGRGKARGRYKPMAEINVTPMVDVMLVLLIIFMVAAPLMTVGVPVDLPKTQASALNQNNEPITITVDPEGRIFLQETEVPLEGLVAQLQAIAGEQAQGAAAGAEPRRIFVRGDRAISYGRVMEVMGTISAGGFSRVALLAEQPAGRPATPAARPAPAGARPQAPQPAPRSQNGVAPRG
ncbi:protein TolR [Siccirubricoccus sp. G192]|uniref:protein TolR n=1 Tax=Siccirubricoccus sp. G192 TaxID=2849651 RepID=UPI001C2C5CF7|nr:protein TolR [Siccirubricoccus sp. G192]MBV1798012.1 protein TolR [Siccirubricoccus sp. G192]